MSEITAPSATPAIMAWPRKDGRKGIRNVIAVAYLVECAHHVATKIAAPFEDDDVHVIGFPGCVGNDYSQYMMEAICTSPNVGAVLLLSLGCESFKKRQLARIIEESGRPVHLITIQEAGGTLSSISEGRKWVAETRHALDQQTKVPMEVSELVVGTICGGSDGTSGIAGNPAAGRAFDRLVQENATCIFEETGELIGCEHIMARRAATPEVAEQIMASVKKAASYYDELGLGSFSQGNADGGLTTIEEKSLGAYAKSGASQIMGVIKPGMQPEGKGLYLLDVVCDGGLKYGVPNITDNQEIIEMIACGCHLVTFVTGRGSVAGSALAPVIKICANPDTYKRMEGDMDVNAGRIVTREATLDEVGNEIYELIIEVSNGKRTKHELLGHQEFVMCYKLFSNEIERCAIAAE
ncbi:hydrolase [Rhodobacteraceae bacterium RKSG542]|uniref:UxaA family hydrolase n=1 Tax=Pseudovibrio flavus TaxID=2529854 RepID=UPI0012BBF07F|nr:UxaA family hydrolase [Pseudovibrio flavus]MTI15737.1 hydrolase [Pseudovibrio flavus]